MATTRFQFVLVGILALAMFCPNIAHTIEIAPLILPWQKAQERTSEDIKKIMGPRVQKEPSRDLNILWVWGIDQYHDQWKDAHEYVWAMDRFCYDLPPNVPLVNVTVRPEN